MTIRSIHKTYGPLSPISRLLLCALILVIGVQARAQFAPVVGYPGTTAIEWDSSAYVAWATGCTIHRGLRCVAVPDSGYASVGDSSSAIGPATQSGVVSLGDGGEAIVTFASPIVDGPGFDFAVFENGFTSGPPGFAFLELGFVEVSTDGVRYVRFPAISNVEDTFQIGLAPMDGSLLNNLAGKYIYGYGTPFDLHELVDSPGLDVYHINYVKVIDVVGSIDSVYGTRDSRGRIINDPFPTNSPSSGFDLDAVGVINQYGASGISQINGYTMTQVYPNPFIDFVKVQSPTADMYRYQVTDLSGRIVSDGAFIGSTSVALGDLSAGVYTIRVSDRQTVFSKLIVKQ